MYPLISLKDLSPRVRYSSEAESGIRACFQRRSGRSGQAFIEAQRQICAAQEFAQGSWTQSQLEAYIQYYCHSTEVSGRFTTDFRICKEKKSPNSSLAYQSISISGILLEYIDGFPLTDLQDCA
jgi:hypothetical protein